MPDLTVKGLSEIVDRSEKTVYRWVDEGRKIIYKGKEYIPERHPGGGLFFTAIVLEINADDDLRPPIHVRSRRRVLSPGIK